MGLSRPAVALTAEVGLAQQIEFVGQPTSQPGRSPIILGGSGAKTANAIGLLPHDNEPLRNRFTGS
jgi:hypothetical protein